ncbi:MAG: hypothetical protein IKK01_06985 [Clostridia bacterium]|nr:hypothetical protein [Clostridia bacterium]
MKKRLIAMLLLISMLFAGVACTGEGEVTTAPEETTKAPEIEVTAAAPETEATEPAPETTAEPETTVLDKSKKYNFLFIGNSYTHYNDMPEQIFAKILKAAGYDATVTRITKGGWYLIDSAKSTDEVGAKVESALQLRDYDYIVLQEQSTCPAVLPDKFYTGVRNLTEKIRAEGATPILYGTWGRKTGHSVLTENGWTNESMTWMISAAYEAIGAELGIDVAYAGLAFYDVYTNNKKIEIYDDDKTHPSPAGSYLAAMTIFAKITGVDPTTVNYTYSVPHADAEILKEAARKAVFETPAIPEKYKTSSVGVEFKEQTYAVDASAMKNLTAFPKSELISVLQGGTYPNGKSFSGILGTKNAIASLEYSTTGLTDAQKADIADIGYGVSVIGIEKMFSSSKGYTTAVENLVNGHWGSSFMACFEFDGKKYNINGSVDESAPYIGLITLNFGAKYKFDAYGFSSGSLEGFPGVAEVFVSDDGVNWTRVPTACWNKINGSDIVSCGKTPGDPWNGNGGTVTCLFDMAGVSGQYIRLGIVVGRNDAENKYNTINTREILVYGEKLN